MKASIHLIRRARVFASVLLIFTSGLVMYHIFIKSFLVVNRDKSSTYIYQKDDPPAKTEDVLFLKTHKTASSSITSILNRFVDSNNLDIALPYGDKTRFSWPEPFRVNSADMSRIRERRANCLCNHAVFSSKLEFEKVLYPGAKYITILREPVAKFESLFFYDKFHKLFQGNKIKNPLLSFVNSINDKTITKRMTDSQRTIFSVLFRDGMLFDLTGYASHDLKRNLTRLIKQVEETFDVVLLTEYFDEGLMILRQLFNWEFLDIFYERKNYRKNRYLELLTEEVKAKIEDLNRGDMALYKHFKEKFQEKIKAYGKEFKRHVEIFQELNKEMNSQCNMDNSTVSISRLNDAINKLDVTRREKKIIGHLDNIPKCFCAKFRRAEVPYLKYFKRKFPAGYFILMDHDSDRQNEHEMC